MKKRILSILLAALMVVSLLPMTALAGTISTVSDVLNTVTDGFPTLQGDIPENAWTTDSGSVAFIYNGYITFWYSSNMYRCPSLDSSVSEESGNYVYTSNTLTVTFNMQDGVLVSINFNDTNNAIFNGLYTSPTASASATPVTSVNVNWTSPAAGTTVNELFASLTDYLTYTDSANKGTIVSDWLFVLNSEEDQLDGTDSFESGKTYSVYITYSLPKGYYYDNEVKYDGGTYSFDPTEKLTVTTTGFDSIEEQYIGKLGEESVCHYNGNELIKTDANAIEIVAKFTIGAAAKELFELLPFSEDNINKENGSYIYNGTAFSVDSNLADEDGIFAGTSKPTSYTLTVTAKDPSITITKIEAVIGYKYENYSSIEISSGTKDNAPSKDGDTVSVSGIDDDTFTFSGSTAHVQIKDIRVYYTVGAPAAAHTHDGVTFEPWDSDNSLPNEGGNWYLTKDVTLTKTWDAPASTTNLCLNGHVIRQTGGCSVMTGGGGDKHILNIYDCDQATNHEGYLDKDGLWHLGTLTDYAAAPATKTDITGGIITGGSGGGSGGGFLYTNGGIVTLYGGTICGNLCSTGHGGAVSTSSGSFAMYGGAIRYNRARNGAGGIYTFSNGKLILGGNALICDNTSEYFGKDDVRSANSGTITLASGTNGPKAGMQVGLAGDLIRVYGATKAEDANYFFCDDNTKTLGYNSTEGCLEYVMDPVSYVVRDAEGNETPATCTNYIVVDSSIESFSPDLWYVVNTDTTINAEISSIANLILCDGCTLTAKKGINVYSDETLNIYGQSGDTGTLIATGVNGKAGIGSFNTLVDNGTVNIHGGIIQATGNEMGGASAGIGGCNDNYDRSGGGTVNIYGGTVTAEGKGGAAGIGGGAGGAAANVTIGKRLAVMNITSGEPGTKVTMSGTWGATLNGIQKVRVELDNSHAHDFTYSATDNVLTATCKATDCDLHATPTTLTLTTPTNLVYDNTAKELTFASGEADAWTAAGCATPIDIVYYLEDGTTKTTTENSGAEGEGKAPVNAGTYVAKVTVDTNKTAVLEFTVAKKQLSKLHPYISWFADRGYKGDNSVAMLKFDAPIGKSLFADDCGFIGGLSELSTFHNAVLDTFEKEWGASIVATATMTSNAPVNYEFTVSVDLPTEYAGNYEVPDFKITAKVKGIYAKPANGEGYTLDEGTFAITVTDGYEVSATPSDFTSPIISGTPLTEGNTYYIRRAGDENYYASPETAFVAEVAKCEYTETVSLTEGTFGMKLGGKDMGWFKFEAVDGGWSIYNGSKYLAMKDGKLILSDTAFAWTYKNGAFSTSVKTTKEVKTSCGILGWLFGFGGKTAKKDVTTTYYLNTVTDGQKLATCCTCAELYTTVSGEHAYKYVNKHNGTHDKICKNCGEKINEACVYDQDSHTCVCGAYDPNCATVDVTATYATKTQKQSYGLLGWLFGYSGKKVTSYTATVKVNAEGLKVMRVEVAASENGAWTKSNTFTSNTEIEKFYVRVTTSDGTAHLFMVKNGIGCPVN